MNRKGKAVCPACCHWPSRGWHGLEFGLTALWSFRSELALKWVWGMRVWEGDLLSRIGASPQCSLRWCFMEVQWTAKARSDTWTLSGGRGGIWGGTWDDALDYDCYNDFKKKKGCIKTWVRTIVYLLVIHACVRVSVKPGMERLI